jgi:hypothetical protein
MKIGLSLKMMGMGDPSPLRLQSNALSGKQATAEREPLATP